MGCSLPSLNVAHRASSHIPLRWQNLAADFLHAPSGLGSPEMVKNSYANAGSARRRMALPQYGGERGATAQLESGSNALIRLLRYSRGTEASQPVSEKNSNCGRGGRWVSILTLKVISCCICLGEVSALAPVQEEEDHDLILYNA